jgi:N-acetylglucosaminyldiphosphoundecaprenol N-acetyl-beta-D-mannosaminyltransferase
MEEVKILDMKLHRVNVLQLLHRITDAAKTKEKLKIFYLNVHAFNIGFKDAYFEQIIGEGDVVFCDGFGVKLAAKILGVPVGERMTPPDWIDDLCNRLSENNFSIFLLGDEPGVAEKCAKKLSERHPKLKIAGTYHGFFEKKGSENERVIQLISEAKPHVTLVGFGMPLQEKWVIENFESVNSHVFITVGALFRWYAKIEKRGPHFFTNNGLEWLWRLFVQPRKVWRRYLIELPVFFGVILKKKFFQSSRYRHVKGI